MPRPYTSGVVRSAPEPVWTVLREFNGLSGWMPAIAASRLTAGTEGAPGAVRRLTLGDGGELDEELLALDDGAMTMTYRIVGENPFGVRRYVSTVRVAPLTMTGETFVEWWSEYDADAGAEQQLTEVFSKDIYEAAIRALQERFG
ncbi:MAG: SRPBCC family protein [Actinomycetota bacterium]|nr:SRPBCC family protein [Actinomycetota bacterium]